MGQFVGVQLEGTCSLALKSVWVVSLGSRGGEFAKKQRRRMLRLKRDKVPENGSGSFSLFQVV